MSFERDQSHAHEHGSPDAAALDADVAPGRKAASSRLVAPTQPITSALIQRKAERDGNGVAADASEHVERAASSPSGSGAALPDGLRSRFESSLGADLSSVRVHTGAASATAAQAVGAKAYTIGQDIHFGAGTYDPSSSAGQHLLAHEVAHTVQQSGGAATRKAQFKLEVSTPHDQHELEADRAADAMVAGTRATVSVAGGSAARAIVLRDTLNDGNYQTVLGEGQAAESDAAKQNQILEGPTAYLSASNESERQQASMMRGAVSAGESELLQAETDHEPVGPRLSDNKAAGRQLDAYIGSAAKQGTMAQQFEIQLQKVNIQYAKLEGMYKAAVSSLHVDAGSSDFDASRADKIGLNGSSDTWDAKKTAKQQAVNTRPGTAAETKAKDDEITLCKANITRLSAELGKFPNQIGEASGALKQSLGVVNAAVAKTELPAPKMEDTAEQAKCKQHIDAAKADMQAAAAMINTAVSVATTGFGAITLGGGGGNTMQVNAPGSSVATIEGGQSGLRPEADIAGGSVVDVPKMEGSAGDVAVADKIRGHVGTGASLADAMSGAEFGFVEGLASSLTGYEQRVKAAQGAIDAISDDNTKRVMQLAQQEMLNAKEGLRNTVEKLGKLRTEMEVAKKLLRGEADRLMTLIDGNKKADGSGPDFGVALAFQTESTIFLADCDAAIQIGEKERDAAKEINPNVKTASPDAPSLGNNISNSRNNAAVYWTAYSQQRPDKQDKRYWTYVRHQVVIATTGQETMDKDMDTVMEQLEKDRTTIVGFNDKLKQYTGL